MISFPNRFKNVAIGTTAALAVLLLASCATAPRSSPQQVAESNPTVTYSYRNDDELVQAGQRAVIFCSQHQALPQAVADSFSVNANGDTIVMFECFPNSSAIANTSLRQPNTDLSYNFRTDQELLNASRDAQVYCLLNNGSPEMDSNIVTQLNGNKTVTFRCNRQ